MKTSIIVIISILVIVIVVAIVVAFQRESWVLWKENFYGPYGGDWSDSNVKAGKSYTLEQAQDYASSKGYDIICYNPKGNETGNQFFMYKSSLGKLETGSPLKGFNVYKKASLVTISNKLPIIDQGYPDDNTKPLKRGFYDIIGQGVKNDYCRYVGDKPVYFACQLSDGTDIFAKTFRGKNVEDIIKENNQTPTPAPIKQYIKYNFGNHML